MAIPLALGAAGGILGSGLLRNLALQGGITALSAGLANPDATRKALGSSGKFLGDVGGNLVRDVFGTQLPNRQIGGIPAKDKSGESYRSQELRFGSQARADQIGRRGSGAGGSVGGGNMGGFIPPGASPTPFANPAAERAYQSERSSVAQQAAQNPELQRYQDQAALARQALQGYNPASGPLPGAAQTAQDMGMAMWAKANPGLAANVRPGQSGFGAIQNTLAGSAANTGFQLPSQLLTTPPPPVTPTPFPTAIPQSGFQVPGAPTAEQLSSYPQFDPKKIDIGRFSKFMQANPKK
jgi:hypothetical protein